MTRSRQTCRSASSLEVRCESHLAIFRVILTPLRLFILLGSPSANVQTQSPSADGLQTSRRLQGALPKDAVVTDPDDSDEEEDNSDAELFAHARKLDAHARERRPPRPTASQSKTDDPDRNPSEEIFPSPGTRAGAEKERRTQAAKVAPYIPPRGTRAASMVEGRTRGASVRRR